MFSLFKKDPVKTLQKQYESVLARAMLAQRKGDIKSFSKLSAEAELIADKIANLEP